MTRRTGRWADQSTRCPRCSLQQPPDGHDGPCAEWYAQMAAVERGARHATQHTPSSPVRGPLAVDLLAHLRARGVPDPVAVVQTVLDLGWRPRPWEAAPDTVVDPAGTGDLLEELGEPRSREPPARTAPTSTTSNT